MITAKDEKEGVGEFLKRRISRRQAIKAGGLVAAGLIFAKPLINTIHPKPAFANLSPVLGTGCKVTKVVNKGGFSDITTDVANTKVKITETVDGEFVAALIGTTNASGVVALPFGHVVLQANLTCEIVP